MRYWTTLLLATTLAAFAQSSNIVAAKMPQLPDADAVRVREFYRLAEEIQDRIWPGWGKVPAPLLLVTQETEFLSNASAPPDGFSRVAEGWYARPRVLPVGLQATAPFFGPPAIIAVGEPENTASKTSTPWLITLMHEHFHQLQWAQPGYQKAVDALGLSGGDTTGMWMLNYAFPYEKPEVAQGFAHLRDLLLAALAEPDSKKFAGLARTYALDRKKFMAQLSPDDHKYFAFQLWQEGMARYTQIKAAEAAAGFKPGAEYVALSDYESFGSYATKARSYTLDELGKADLATWKRQVVYSFGGAEGLLLDRINPKWKDKYFQGELSTDSYFEVR
jgi:hypothetical protein